MVNCIRGWQIYETEAGRWTAARYGRKLEASTYDMLVSMIDQPENR